MFPPNFDDKDESEGKSNFKKAVGNAKKKMKGKKKFGKKKGSFDKAKKKAFNPFEEQDGNPFAKMG